MPLLPLDTFRQQMQMHPYHFWQLANATVPVSNQCDALVYQYAWQNVDAVGRSDILAAIDTAEYRLREWLGYSVAPRYAVETVPWPQYPAGQYQAWGPAGLDGHWRTIQLSEGYIQNAGVEAFYPISLNAAVTYSDADGDGINDTFMVTGATTILDASTLGVYFVFGDLPPGEGVGERWRVQPVQTFVNGSAFTIKGRAWTMVKPRLYNGIAPVALDPSVAGVLATTVHIYQRIPASFAGLPQATLIWDTLPWPSCCTPDITGSAIADPNAIGTATGRVGITDSRRGIVHVGQADYDATTGLWVAGSCNCWRPPDRAIIRYYAGLPFTDYNGIGDQFHDHQDDGMAVEWQAVVSRLAAAELARPICACASANRALFHWQEDMARTGGNNDAQFGAISATDLDNPFGTRRGHIYAWRQVNHLRIQRGLFAG